MSGEWAHSNCLSDSSLEIQLIGSMAIWISGVKVSLPRRHHTRRLLALLLLRRQAISRAEAAYCLWPEMNDRAGRDALRRHLFDLDDYLQSVTAGRSWLRRNKYELQWRPLGHCRVDLHAVLAAAERFGPNRRLGGRSEVDDIERVVTSTQEPLLDGWSESWLESDRAQLHSIHQLLGDELVSCYERAGYYRRAMEVIEGLLRKPSEFWFRRMMSIQFALGDIAGSLESFERCQSALGVFDGSHLDAKTMRLREIIIRSQDVSLGALPRSKSDSYSRLVTDSCDSCRDHRPLYLDLYVDSGAELERLENLIDSERLAIVCGQRGTGKSRLVARLMEVNTFGHEREYYWIDVARCRSELGIEKYLLAFMGIEDLGRADQIEVLNARMRLHVPFIVFDTCDERIHETLRLASRIIDCWPSARVVLVCRSRHGCSELPFVDLPRLSFHTASDNVKANVAAQLYDSVSVTADLIEARISEYTGLASGGKNQRSILDSLCVMTDGLPQAIELLAGKSLVLNLNEIVSHAEQVLLETVNFRQRAHRCFETLGTSIRSSVEDLAADDRLLIERMSICHEWFAANVVNAIVFGSRDVQTAEERITDQLRRLCNDGWLEGRVSHTLDFEYRIPSIVRQLNRNLLRCDATRLVETQSRYAAFFLSQVILLANGSDDKTQLTLDYRIGADRNDIRAALRYSLDQADKLASLAIRASSELWRHWVDGGAADEELALLQETVRLNAAVLDAKILAIGHDTIGMMFYAQGDLEIAEHHCRLAVDLLRPIEDPDQLAIGVIHHAGVLAMSGNIKRAASLAHEAVSLMTDKVAPLVRIDILGLSADICVRGGDLNGADAMLNTARHLVLNLSGPPRRVGRVYLRMGSIAIERGEYLLAESMLERAVVQAERSGSRKELNRALGELSLARRWRGQAEDSSRLLVQVIRHAADIGDRLLQATCYCNLADVWYDELRLDHARFALDKAREVSRGIISVDLELDIRNIEIMMILEMKDNSTSYALLPAMERLTGQVSDSTSVGWALRTMALGAASVGDFRMAAKKSADSVRHFTDIGSLGSLLRSLEVGAAVGLGMHRHASAAQLLGACATERARIGAPRTPRELRDVSLWMEQIVQALGPTETDAQIRAGATLSLDEAVELALSLKVD